MYVIKLSTVEALVKELAEAGAGAVLGGVLWCQELCEQHNLAKWSIGSLWTAVLKFGEREMLVECELSHGLNLDKGRDGTEAYLDARREIKEACQDLDIRLKEGRVDLL